MIVLRLVVLALAAVIVQGAQTPPASDPAACNGLLSQPARLAGVLSLVPKYGSTYVLVVPQRLADKVPNADAPGLKTIEVGIHGGTAGVDVARALGLTRVREYALDLGTPAPAARAAGGCPQGRGDPPATRRRRRGRRRWLRRTGH